MSDSESHRFADPVVWLVVFTFCLLFYVFAYPIIWMVIETASGLSRKGFAGVIFAGTVAPLNWLYETFSVYETYVDFLDELVS